jgi:hypothetical protein
MKKNSLFILIAWIGLIESSKSATYSVFSGQSIQAKIDAASSGDTIAIFGGSYTENLTVSKDVRLQLVAGQTVTLAGNITFSGLSNAYTFANFTWGGQTDKTITVNDCRNFTINGINSPAGGIVVTGLNTAAKIFVTSLTSGGITVSGGANVQGMQSSCTGITVNGSSTADFARCTVTGNVSVASDVKRISFCRGTVTESLDSAASETYLSYSTIRWFRHRSNGKAFLLGNTINERNARRGNTIEITDTAQTSLFNNIIRDGAETYSENNALYATSASRVLARNNIFYNYSGSSYYGGNYGLRLDGSNWNQIISNIGIAISNEFLTGPSANNIADYNISQSGSSGGILLLHHLSSDPLFVDANQFVLSATSPARNAGDPDPRFNDIDGTRNDMGIYGGPFYDPEGRTGSKPVVMQMQLDQTQFLKGDYSTLKLKAVGSATGTAP